MATIAPATFAQGDLPDAVKLTTYSTALTNIHNELGDVPRQGGARHTYTTTASGQQITKGHIFRHFYRYLLYSGDSGTIEVISGAGDSVTLPDVGSGSGLYDLRGVSWLFHGKFYRVTGDDLTWCQEVDVLLI